MSPTLPFPQSHWGAVGGEEGNYSGPDPAYDDEPNLDGGPGINPWNINPSTLPYNQLPDLLHKKSPIQHNKMYQPVANEEEAQC